MTMITGGCGCSASSCSCTTSCCDGNDALVPEEIRNAPAQPALRHRIGTHATFFESMLAWLVTPPEQAAQCDAAPKDEENPDPLLDGETNTLAWPLRDLTTRELDDPTIALLDAWAMVGDVLTFYQERIANEGYLRTAIEQRSVEELARLVGYRPRPGVAASVDLAFTLEKGVSTTIPANTRAQSLPAPGKLPQTFETSRPFVAKAVWNALRPLQSRFLRPRVLDGRLELYLAGTANNMRINDVVFVAPGKAGVHPIVDPLKAAAAGLFRVDRVDILADISKTRVRLRRYTNDPIPVITDPPQDDVPQFPAAEVPEYDGDKDVDVAAIMGSFSDDATDARYLTEREILDLIDNDLVLRDSVRLAIEAAGVARNSKTELFAFRASSPLFGHNAPAKRFLGTNPDKTPIEQDWPNPTDAPEGPATLYLDAVDERVQPDGYIVVDQATSIEGQQEGGEPFTEDEITALLKPFRPNEDHLFGILLTPAAKRQALGNIARDPTLVQRFWLNELNDVVKKKKDDLVETDELTVNLALAVLLGDQQFVDKVDELTDPDVEGSDKFITRLNELAAGAKAADKPNTLDKTLAIHSIKSIRTYSRDAYGLAKQTLELTLDGTQWIQEAITIPLLRSIVTHHESEALRVARTPLEPLGGSSDVKKKSLIEIEGLVFDLEPGRTLIIEGEDANAPGAIRTERLTISAIRHDLVDVSTQVTLTEPLEYVYLRARTTIYANVTAATQGESRREVLGSGDASKPSQRFTLRHQPLTHVPAATASGAASTLTVRVNNFAWPEIDNRVLLGPRDRNITTTTDEQGRTIVTGGDGWQGARFPTGIENIIAEYRSGQGADGNVDPHKATNLVTRPFGVQKVTNPLAASGGADPDDIESTRLRAPLAVEALDRLLSVDDYRSFALNFAGIAKAEVTRIGSQDVFAKWHIRTVVAGVEPKPLDPASELMLRLTQAMQQLGDPSLDLVLLPAKLQRLTIKAKLAVAPGYAFRDIEPLVRAWLIQQLSYAKQDIGRAIPPSRIAALMQTVVGVGFVDLDELSIVVSDTQTETDDNPLVFEPEDTMIVPDADTILFLDPTHPETLVLEEVTP